MKKTITLDEVKVWLDTTLGDVYVVSTEVVGSNIRVVWKEDEFEDDAYFSVVGYNKWNKVIEKIGGEF